MRPLPPQTLKGRVALVTGASRGLGRGIAAALRDAGATVYATSRTATTAEGVVSVVSDHRDDDAVAAVFARIEAETDGLDVLVNNATAVPDLDFLFSDRPFWELPVDAWDSLIAVGLRSHFVASRLAARSMAERRSGLIVNISSAGAQQKIGILPYGVGKAALDHMTKEMAVELREFGVAVVALWPPPSKTEGMLAHAGAGANTTLWSSTEFTGRVIAALAAGDPLVRTGEVLRIRELAAELGVADDAELS